MLGGQQRPVRALPAADAVLREVGLEAVVCANAVGCVRAVACLPHAAQAVLRDERAVQRGQLHDGAVIVVVVGVHSVGRVHRGVPARKIGVRGRL